MTPSEPTSLARRAAAILLTALLVLLAFRLTANETLRDTLSQKIAAVLPPATDQAGAEPVVVPFVGPAFTAAYAAIAFLLAAGAALLGESAGAVRGRRRRQLALLGLIAALLLASTWRAANRFQALIGTADIAAALGAAWTVAVLCHDDLLGRRGRQAVIAAIVAICALGCAKALLQEFIEFPDLAQLIREHPDAAMRNAGINPDDPVQRTMFLARANSREVTGYGALANVFATQMVAGIALLTGLAAAGIWMRKLLAMPAAKGRHAPPAGRAANEIPLHVIGLAAVGILLIVSAAVLLMTDSKGGIAAAALAAAAIVPGVAFRRWVAARRRWLIAGAALAAVLLPAAVVGWGLSHHGLPTRSLLFRWQYWTGAAPMVENSPVWGVGLNNFGDYYKRYKMPSSPEDVQDPHSFFVRLAAEGGIPAAALVGALILWMLQGAWRRRAPAGGPEDPTGTAGFRGALLLAGCGVLAWLPLHFLAEIADEYTLILTFLMAVFCWAVFAAVMALFDGLDDSATRVVALSCVAGALAMLLYDQVNMALVTGPVAMLFWIMLAVGESTGGIPAPGHSPSQSASPLHAFTRFALPPALLAVSATTAIALWFPLAAGDFAWNPAPYEYAYIRQAAAGHVESAALALDAAIARAPNNVELRLQRITLWRALHRPVAAEIRQVFALDRANAAPRLLLALPDTDLPPAERIAALTDALAFDRQLAPGEPKRLTAHQIQEIDAALARLRAPATTQRVE